LLFFFAVLLPFVVNKDYQCNGRSIKAEYDTRYQPAFAVMADNLVKFRSLLKAVDLSYPLLSKR